MPIAPIAGKNAYTAQEVAGLLTTARQVRESAQAADVAAAQAKVAARITRAAQAGVHFKGFKRALYEQETARLENHANVLNSVSFSAWIYVIYPRLAKAILTGQQWGQLQSQKPNNGQRSARFTKLPVTHEGHDVWVYWQYEDWDIYDAWTFADPMILQNPGALPHHPGHTQGHPETP